MCTVIGHSFFVLPSSVIKKKITLFVDTSFVQGRQMVLKGAMLTRTRSVLPSLMEVLILETLYEEMELGNDGKIGLAYWYEEG